MLRRGRASRKKRRSSALTQILTYRRESAPTCRSERAQSSTTCCRTNTVSTSSTPRGRNAKSFRITRFSAEQVRNRNPRVNSNRLDRHTSLIARFQERCDKLIFASESTQQGRVHVASKPGFSREQQRDTPDDTELPLPWGEKGLKIACRLQCRGHRRASAARILANHARRSTKPEVAGGGGTSMGSSPVPKSTASGVSADSISLRRTSQIDPPQRVSTPPTSQSPASCRHTAARRQRTYPPPRSADRSSALLVRCGTPAPWQSCGPRPTPHRARSSLR